MKNNDETILEILQGHKTSKWPTPKIVKIYISSTKPDFKEERRVLLENVGPELNSLFEDQQIEVELIDMHYGAMEKDYYDPRLFDDYLYEIRTCHKLSRGCFFLNLIGNKYDPFVVPLKLDSDTYFSITDEAKELGLNYDILETWYKKDSSDDYVLKDFSSLTSEEWIEASHNIVDVIHESLLKIPQNAKKKNLVKSAIEQQFDFALGLAPGTAYHVASFIRNWTDDISENYAGDLSYNKTTTEYCKNQLREFHNNINLLIPEENRLNLSVPWSEGGISLEIEEHETYINKFKNNILNILKQLIKKSLEDDPDLKSRKKIVEENFQENITHLTLCYGDMTRDFSNSELLEKVKNLVQSSSNSRHNPIIIYGNQGSGKTSLIQSLYRNFENWFNCRTLRIVRFISKTPRSSYNLELLRVICQQICIALKLPEGFLPKDASFDPLYINNWFQSLLRNFEDMNQVLVIFIDDLHMLNPLDSDSVSTLSWLPITLPKRVHMICTSGVQIDNLRMTPVQKERLRTSDYYFEMAPADSYVECVNAKLKNLEEIYGVVAISKLCALMTCSEYGLTEIELLEILMPTSNIEAVILTKNGNYNFSSLCSVKRKLEPLLKEKIMSGKLLLEWRYAIIKEIVVQRYFKSEQETVKNTHNDLANLFFSEFCEENENSESEGEPAPLMSEMRETPFQSTLHKDVTYSQRHIEESWIHLLKAGDINKLKSLCMCNYDFLLAALQTISVSYLRCLLEHVRCYILDREIELVYHSIRKSTDVLTRDTYQLGTQLISWLRPVKEKGGGLMNSLVTSAMAWCDGFTLPLVVPLTDWLQPPLPSQSKLINTPNVRLTETTPSGQHVVCVVDTDPQLWHIMSNQLIHTFKGHSGRVLCMAITKQSQYLLTGSEDISIIIWDLKSLTMKQRIYEHIAPVLCITSALNNSVIISGGEDSSIIVTSLAKGSVVMKIDHHRGPVTAVKVTSGGDILISGSIDRNVCVWSLDSYSLLNTLPLPSPVHTIDVSADSIFLLALCTDNNLYLRSLATGTELHSLLEHKSKVRSICLTQDSCRAVIGCSDSKAYIYDIHSAKVIKTLSGNNGEVTSVKVTEKDDFLLTTGGSRVIFYPFRSDDHIKSFLKFRKKCHQNLQAHAGYISCLDVSRDGQLSVTGGTDNLVNIWQLNNQELLMSLKGHSGPVTSVCFAPSVLYVASGSEDKTVRVWGLNLGSLVCTFTGHHSAVCNVFVLLDSERIISSDRNENLYIWSSEDGSILQSFIAPSKCIRITNNMKYAVATNGDTSLKIWSVSKEDEKYTVNHSEEITCFVLTVDSQQIITGSKDMSLKVWQVKGGKLSQVLIGHTDAVTCVSVSILDKTQLVSGSCDNNLIVWDINTGADLHTLTGHLSYVASVKSSGDGTMAISGSDDKSIIIWDTKRGLQLTSLQLHYPIISIEPVSDFSRISVLLKDTQYSPIICLHNTPAKYVKLPTYCAPDKDMIENSKSAPKRQMKRLLKKEVSLDTYTWQKKYAHLTSNLVIPAVDERFKRRFSVSASMEEISKIPQNKDAQGGMGSKQASLAQSQHFDQLEALWNKRSPPRRRIPQSLSKQSSFAESHLDSSDEERAEESKNIFF